MALKGRGKFVQLAARQIADKTQRTVQVISYAHSTAKLKDHPEPADQPSPQNGYVPVLPSDGGVPPGDLNSAYPSVFEQADCAAVKHNDAEMCVGWMRVEVGA